MLSVARWLAVPQTIFSFTYRARTTEAEKQDKDLYESLKGDADGILVFLQEVIPDSSNATNALLTQISQQLVTISSGAPLAIVAAQNSQPLTPTASAVRVNVLWFLSLAISLNCALSATLMQQCAR
ncbi:hypothetical protein EDB83DRAFT_2517325 [Lactarius deliciosus]|nr:hypothetical protein EDB83DRAFT_2517325 [Lactarius deliciosus]